MKVIRDSNGRVINIGEWDYQKQVIINDFGEEEVVIQNKLPEGSTESDEEVITGWDDGLYAANDPRARND